MNIWSSCYNTPIQAWQARAISVVATSKLPYLNIKYNASISDAKQLVEIAFVLQSLRVYPLIIRPSHFSVDLCSIIDIVQPTELLKANYYFGVLVTICQCLFVPTLLGRIMSCCNQNHLREANEPNQNQNVHLFDPHTMYITAILT